VALASESLSLPHMEWVGERGQWVGIFLVHLGGRVSLRGEVALASESLFAPFTD